MTVSWVTLNSTECSTVQYGVRSLTKSAQGTSNVYVDGGKERRKLFLHRATLTKLLPGKVYGEYTRIYKITNCQSLHCKEHTDLEM